jgi:hypothetical protein
MMPVFCTPVAVFFNHLHVFQAQYRHTLTHVHRARGAAAVFRFNPIRYFKTDLTVCRDRHRYALKRRTKTHKDTDNFFVTVGDGP